MHIFRFFSKPMSPLTVIAGVAVYLSAALNFAFWGHVVATYSPSQPGNLAFLASLAVGHTAFIALILCLLCVHRTLKPVMVLLLLLSSVCAYFMDQYDTVIDSVMLQNAMATDAREAASLFSLTMVLYVALLGALPSWIVLRLPIRHDRWRREMGLRLAAIGGLLLTAGLLTWGFSTYYSSFFREHKDIQHYSNPASYLSSAFHVVREHFKRQPGPVTPIALDARIPATDKDRELIIVVVGETTRADRFSLNGYARKTNPLLEKEDVISFTNVWSCGTSTIYSVPCMFSNFTQDEFDRDTAAATENVMDVLARASVHTLWRDNNSSSKGVAERMQYEPYMTPDVNTICDVECRDEGMLVGLQEYINARPEGDIVIVLHQMGSHGPSYYQRYPASFEVFTPACRTNELKDCTKEELDNVYDNTILYTDYFLAKTIDLLKRNDARFETAMLFIGDHGESLGENGLYLHGMPMMFAPDAQRHVPMIVWLGSTMRGIDREEVKSHRDLPYSQQNIFHTLLGLVEMETTVYDRALDVLHPHAPPTQP